MTKRKRLLMGFSVIAAFVLIPFISEAALPAYMEVEGVNQGKIEGSSISEGREGTIVVYGFGHKVQVPTDPQTGLATEKRIHGPLEVLKEIDKSSPKLYQALVTGEKLSSVIIKFYRMGASGQVEHFFTVSLADAIIVKITPSLTGTVESEGLGPMEIVSFNYRKITWTWEIGTKVESSDDWTATVK